MVDQVRRIAEILAEDRDAAPHVTVREFLNWYASKRRGQHVVARIRDDLAQHNLITRPDFESAWIGGSITFEFAPAPEVQMEIDEVPAEAEPAGIQVGHDDSLIGSESHQWTANDPTHQLSKLQAANQTVLYVAPNDSISVAVTKMLLHDYSQLPVMTNERTVKGVISWKSIGAHFALRREGDEVRRMRRLHPIDFACL